MRITIYGCCDLREDQILRNLTDNTPEHLCTAPGQYVITVEDESAVIIITSISGIVPYFYTVREGHIFHADTVAEVFRRSAMPWSWNFRALADFLMLDHTVGTDTVHADIIRTSPGSVVAFSGGQLRTSFQRSFSDRSIDFALSDIVAGLQHEVLRWWRPETDVLCMSGGFDSRLLLAVLLRAGERPDLLVCGHETSFDRTVARDIAQRFGLKLQECQVTASDFVQARKAVALRSNGTLPLTHWPGVLFARYASHRRLVLGFNGEAVRSYFDDRGLLSWLRSGLPSTGRAAERIWLRRSPRLTPAELEALNPRLAQHLHADSWPDRIQRLMQPSLSLGDALDEAFVSVRSPSKTGADLSAISAYTQWVAPFCSAFWSRLPHHLSRRWKLGTRLHRRLIAIFQPELLGFPEETNPSGTTAAVPGLRQWANFIKSPRVGGFFDEQQYRRPELVGCIDAAVAAASDLIDAASTSAVWQPATQVRLFPAFAALGIWISEVVNNAR
jgi:hypothetical protein